MMNLDRITQDVNTEHEPFLQKQDNVVGLKTALFTVTFFENQSAQTMLTKQITLGQLRHYIQTARKPSKDQLRWLKLASFGNKRSDGHSLRHNANVLSISGVELDYDSKVMQLDEAIDIAQGAGLLALLYTTASYTAATPKWRILLPTSKSLPPEERAKLVARVNGLYGDIFDQASFTLSQAYYFGCVGDNPEHRAVITEGDYIDLRHDLDAGAISKSGTIGQSDDDDTPLVRGSGDPDDQYDNLANALLDPKPAWTPENEDHIWKALCCIPANLVRPDWVEIGMVLHWLHWVDDDGYDWGLEAWDKWSQTSDGNGPGEKGGGYKGRDDIERRWGSFSGEKDKKVKLKRLYTIARKYGWKEDTDGLTIDGPTLSEQELLQRNKDNEKRIVNGLNSIGATCGGDEWVEIGKALQSLGWKDGDNDWGLAIWNSWSSKKVKGYTNKDDLTARWNAFGDHGFTIARLFEIAKLKTKLMQSSAEFVAGYVPPDYLIDGLLQRRYVYSLTAPTGSGKTAIALLIAAHVSRGLPLGNREVEKGRVLMFAGENPDDVRSRWILLCEKMGIEPNAMDVVFMPFVRTLSEDQVRKQIDAEAEEHGPFSLLIVDTSAAYYSGDDENDNVALGNHARMLRTFVDLPGGPTIIVTCHPTKNANMENLLPRGGGAFLAEVDGNLVAIKDDAEMTVAITWHGKFRGPDFPPFSFKLVRSRSEKLVDTKGRKIWSVFAEQIYDEEKEDIARQGNQEQDALLRTMLDYPGFSLKEFAEHLGWHTKTGGEHGMGGEPNKVKVQRMMEGLKKLKLVEKRRDGHYVLTDKGTKEAENTPEDKMYEIVK
jgi:hypothetical protein